jgi:hypothetical protein
VTLARKVAASKVECLLLRLKVKRFPLFKNPFPPGKLHRILYVIFILSIPFVNPIVHGDGVGYYAYVRAPLVEHSFHFEEDWRHANLNFSQSRTRPDGQLLPTEYTETGYVSNLFTIGPALLWTPFLLIANAVVHALNLFGTHIPADGFSFPYVFAMALGTAVYGFLGLLLSFRLAKRYMAERWALLATIAIWWGSSLPVYMYFNPAWSHAHSAFAVALFVWFWDRTRDARTTSQWLLLGLMAGLMVDIYFPNSIFLLLPLIESLLFYSRNLKSQPSVARTLLIQNFLFAFAILVAFIPTIITRRIIFGGYFRFGSYSHLSWDWSAPHWRAVLFSSDHGVFSWTPLLAFAILGLFLVPRPAKYLALYLGLCVAAFYYLIASYPYWDGLSSFGNRFFISLTPIYVFGLAALLQRCGAFFSSQRLSLWVSSLVLAAFVVWNLGFIYQWGAHLIPARGPISFRQAIYNQFYVVPEKIVGHLHTYVFHRRQLMQQIEEKDIEQLRQSTRP